MSNTLISNDINGYDIKSFEGFASKAKFGIRVRFEQNSKARGGFLLKYHLMCAILVLVASANFLIDPKDSNRAAILVALLLVFTNILSPAQVGKLKLT